MRREGFDIFSMRSRDGVEEENDSHSFSSFFPSHLPPSLSLPSRWSNFLASCSSAAQNGASPSEAEGTTSPSLSLLLGNAAAKMASSTNKGIPRGQAELRAAAAFWIASHPTTFAPFLGDGDPRAVAFRYALRISRDAAWGGQAEQVALCQLLGVRMRIFQAGQSPWVIAPSEPEAEEGEEEGEEKGEGWKKPKKTAKKKKSSSGGGDSSGPSENGNGDAADAPLLPVLNVSYHHGEHYNSVVRRAMDNKEAAAAQAARHLRDREAVARALAALGDIEGEGEAATAQRAKGKRRRRSKRSSSSSKRGRSRRNPTRLLRKKLLLRQQRQQAKRSRQAATKTTTKEKKKEQETKSSSARTTRVPAAPLSATSPAAALGTAPDSGPLLWPRQRAWTSRSWKGSFWGEATGTRSRRGWRRSWSFDFLLRLFCFPHLFQISSFFPQKNNCKNKEKAGTRASKNSAPLHQEAFRLATSPPQTSKNTSTSPESLWTSTAYSPSLTR